MPEQVDVLSLGELVDVIEAKTKAEEHYRKSMATICHAQATEIAIYVGRIFIESHDEAPHIWDIYPGFEEEQKAAEERESEILLEKQKMAMKIYMERLNQSGLKEGDT